MELISEDKTGENQHIITELFVYENDSGDYQSCE